MSRLKKNPFALAPPPVRLWDEWRVSKGITLVRQADNLERRVRSRARHGQPWAEVLEWLRGLYEKEFFFEASELIERQDLIGIFEEGAEFLFCCEKTDLAQKSLFN